MNMMTVTRILFTILLGFCVFGCSSTGKLASMNPAVLVDFERGPVKTYNKACKRCHGVEGANFAGEFNRQNRKKVRAIVEDMMIGPAYLKPTESEVEAMTSYMLSIQHTEPFAIITNAASFANGNEALLKGEASPGSIVVIAKDGIRFPTENTDKLTWQIESNKNTPFDVTIEKNGHHIMFTYPDRQWIRQY